MAFPNIATPSVLPLKVKAFVYEGPPSIGAYRVQRRQATRTERRWRLAWDNTCQLSTADKEALLAHFEQNAGSSFSWQHPISLETFTVVYENDEIEFEEPYAGMGYWKCEIILRRV